MAKKKKLNISQIDKITAKRVMAIVKCTMS